MLNCSHKYAPGNPDADRQAGFLTKLGKLNKDLNPIWQREDNFGGFKLFRMDGWMLVGVMPHDVISDMLKLVVELHRVI